MASGSVERPASRTHISAFSAQPVAIDVEDLLDLDEPVVIAEEPREAPTPDFLHVYEVQVFHRGKPRETVEFESGREELFERQEIYKVGEPKWPGQSAVVI